MKNEDVSHQGNDSQIEKHESNKKNLTFLKNLKGISSFMNNSTNYWKNTFQNALCGCDRTDDLIKEDPSTVTSKKNSLFKVTNINQEHNKGKLGTTSQKENEKRKEWSKQESDLLYYNYYTLNKKDFNELKKLFPYKTVQQLVQRIKKYEIKSKLKNFSRQDDLKIIELVDSYGKNWKKISTFFEGYSPEIIEQRYKNKLDPNLKRTKFSPEEDDKILALYNQFGNKWKEIASFFPDRNVNMVKNRYYSFLKRKVLSPNEQCLSAEKGSNNSSSIDTNSIMATTGTLVNDELNFKFQEDVVEQDPFNFFKINEPILRKGESKDEEGGFFRNNSNEFDNKGKDCFFETYQKVFPNETIQTQDLNDSGEHLNKDFNDIVIDNSNEDSEEKYQNFNIKSRKEIEETHKLFKESNNLEEILHKIDSFQFDETNYNIKLLENNKVYQELLENKEKTGKHQQLLYSKLNDLKQNYVQSLKSNQSQTKVLIEINNTLLQLISIAKMQIILSKQINDMKNEARKAEEDKMKVD